MEGRREKVGGGVLGKREDMGGLCGGLEEGSGAQAPVVWHVGVTCGVRVQTEVNCSSPSALPHFPLNRYGGEFLDFFFFNNTTWYIFLGISIQLWHSPKLIILKRFSFWTLKNES